MATPDELYREKVRARAEGRAPTFVSEAAPVDSTRMTPEAIEARYRAKLARHGAPLAAPPEAKAADKGREKGKGGDAEPKGAVLAAPPAPAGGTETKPPEAKAADKGR